MVAFRYPGRRGSKRTRHCLWAVLMVAAALSGMVPAGAAAEKQMPYPYGSDRFRTLVSDSYQVTKGEEAADFSQWLEQAFTAHPTQFRDVQAPTLPELLDQERSILARTLDSGRRAEMEIAFAGSVHKMVKALIPRFSLKRGFEFAYVVKYGERQCLLQSVLVAALLQRAGIDSGIVMVFRNGKKAKSNISHVATLVKLADGTDAVVDASYQTPFVKHTGILVALPSYRFVQPRYAAGSIHITGYREEGTKRAVGTASVTPLGYSFVRSQFWYYRGERASGGVLAAHPTRQGLAASRHDFETSVALCPGNPIAAYMLGQTYRSQGERAKATQALVRARDLYRSYGWLPDGPAQAARGAAVKL